MSTDKRIETLEVRLLMAPTLSQSDCAVVMELANLARDNLREVRRMKAPAAWRHLDRFGEMRTTF